MDPDKIKETLRRNLNEYDLLYDSEEEWEEMKHAVMRALNKALKDIEADNYDDGRQGLKFVIDTLNKWDEILDFKHSSEESGMEGFMDRHPDPKFK